MADTLNLEAAVLAWWEGRRPVGWIEEDHISQPTVNCTTDEEESLARAAAKLARRSSSSVSEGEMPGSELEAFAEWFGTPSTSLSEGTAALVQYWAQEAWKARAELATKAAAPADAPIVRPLDDPKMAEYLSGQPWISAYIETLESELRKARRATSVPAIPGTGREKEQAVAWALVSPKGGIKKVAITRQSVESRMARWLEEWPGNTPRIRPLVYGDAAAAPSHPSEAKAGEDARRCGACNGSGWVPRDTDIGTDQECFVCDGTGAAPAHPGERKEEG